MGYTAGPRPSDEGEDMSRPASRIGPFLVVVVVISFLLSLAGSSLKSTVQVLFLPIADGFDVNRGTLAIATTVFAVVSALASFVIGNLADRIGAVPVLAMGTAVSGAVLVLCAWSGAVWMFIAAYGVAGAVGYTMLSYVPLGVLAGQLSGARHTGVLYAVLTNGAAVGFVVLVPLWTMMNAALAWNQIFLVVGLTFLVVLAPLSLGLLRLSAIRRPHSPAKNETVTLRAGLHATLGNRRALWLIVSFFACGVTMAFIDVHLFPHMHDLGVPKGVGSAAVAVLGVLELIGCLVAGRLCDLGRIRATLVGAYALRAASMMLLPFFAADSVVILFGALFGASYLATVVATTVWLNRVMPAGAQGTALGLLWAVHMVAVALSSQLGAMLADIRHSYLALIVASIGLALGAATIVAAQPNPDAEPVTEAGLAPTRST